MMAEYIRKEDAIKCIEGQCIDGKMFGNDENEGTLIEAYSAIDDLMEIPPADVAPVRHGRWIDRPSTKGQVYCSECATIEKSTDSNYKSRRCPNCGAKMDGGADNG